MLFCRKHITLRTSKALTKAAVIWPGPALPPSQSTQVELTSLPLLEHTDRASTSRFLHFLPGKLLSRCGHSHPFTSLDLSSNVISSKMISLTIPSPAALCSSVIPSLPLIFIFSFSLPIYLLNVSAYAVELKLLEGKNVSISPLLYPLCLAHSRHAIKKYLLNELMHKWINYPHA